MIRMTTVLGALLGIGAGQATQAQESGSQAAARSGAALEEIVVTAERRSERLDQVPIAATVISGQALREQGIGTIHDLETAVPSITVQNQQALSYVNIRGVGLQATNPTTSSGVAVYSDGFFIPHETAVADEYYDVQQVEVLRGPQGTLVGQNSTGGALFINSVRPSFDSVTGSIAQSVGNFDYWQTEGALNVPVSSTLAVRAAGIYYSRDSYYDTINIAALPQAQHQDPGNVDAWSARIGVAWDPVSSLSVYLKFESAKRDGDGYIGKDYRELAGANDALDPHLSREFTISYDQPGSDEYEMSRVSAEVNWNITDCLRLRSLTGYQDASIDNVFDNDQTSFPASWADQRLDEETWQQELNLISENPGPFNWILGAIYLYDEIPTYLHLFTAPPGPPPTFTIDTQPEEESYAVFAQGTYAFSDKWQLLAGARETWDDKEQTGTQTFEIPTGLPAPLPPIIFIPFPLEAEIDGSETTGKIALSYFPDTDSTIYVSASRGFKPGGLNAGNLVSLRFEPETITAYEAGYKASVLDNRLRTSLAAFYYDYEEMQTTAIDPIGQRAIINIQDSTIYGAELELDAQLGNLSLNFGGSYNDSSVDGPLVLVDAGNPFAGPQDLDDRELPYAPEWSVHFGGSYVVPTSIGTYALTAQYSWTDSAYASLFQLEPRDLLDSHSLLNATLSVNFNNGIWLELYGTNLTDETYAAGSIGVNSAVWNSPRRYGARIGYRF